MLLDLPQLHAYALYRGIQSEKNSQLLEDIFEYRYLKQVERYGHAVDTENLSADHLVHLNERLRYSFESKTEIPYQNQDYLNNRMGIDVITLITLIQTDVLHLC